MSRETRMLARELRPGPRRRSGLVRLVGWVLRWSPEITTAVVVVWAWRACADRLGAAWSAVLWAVVVVVLVVVPVSRRALLSLLGCAVTRHRLRTACVELRLSSRSGRLPVVVWLWPTRVGERVRLWCPAGVAAEDFADDTDHLRAACYAREVRVTRDRRWSALVTVDVIRRDPLSSDAPIPAAVRAVLRRG